MATQLDLKLHSFYYDGENRGFNLHKFVNLHQGQHIIADELMKYGYSGVDENSKVRMLINGINTNVIKDCKAAILDIIEIQGDFDISSRHLIEFISMILSLQKNATEKLSSITRSGGGRGGWHGSDCGSSITDECDVQAPMSAINNKYFRGY